MKDYHHCGMQHGSDQISHGQADLHATTWELWGLFFLFSGVLRTAELGPCQCRRERQTAGGWAWWIWGHPKWRIKILLNHCLTSPGVVLFPALTVYMSKVSLDKTRTLNSPQWTRQHLAWQQLPIGVWMYVCEWVNEWFGKMLWAPSRGRALYKCSPFANLS